jgi:hypothetical protein
LQFATGAADDRVLFPSAFFSPREWRDACIGQRGRLSLLELSMLDLVFVAATIGCFAAAFAYTRACDRV